MPDLKKKIISKQPSKKENLREGIKDKVKKDKKEKDPKKKSKKKTVCEEKIKILTLQAVLFKKVRQTY